ncbi:glyoxalase/bleomycin resistance/extradiol dioxygenase family protein [Niabella yanshanensis]|uniref:Glyoxalase/bleomycin resistance/extradiol dioxygenase family protein n=1 Tax=Niabella yanshanensis TaxID=577386 RepID=A0ABZ0W5R7_9BACT|nr:VOC family protein [Niabella yanshanensis]WQD38274.1 glyoxalase/bleomycin resistance/extradiol dioxygenase family protein [Niabella yanshanensis]
MSQQIFVNLPVKDLQQSMDFYTAIGFTNNPQFTDDKAACMVVSDTIFIMLLTHDRFKDFTSKEIADTKKTVAVLNALSVASAEAVNDTLKKALAAGGNEYAEPKDYGFMQQRCFEDLDGHNWEITYMDMSQFPQ